MTAVSLGKISRACSSSTTGLTMHVEVLHARLLRQHLHHRVGVHQRGRLGADDQQRFLGGAHEEQHVVADAGARIDQHQVEHVLDPVQRRAQPQLLLLVQAGQRLHARAARQDLHPVRALDQHVLDRHAMPSSSDADVVLGLEPEDDLHVGQAQVGVDDQHALAGPGRQHRQVGGHVGLAHAALAAGHRDDPQARAAAAAQLGAGRTVSCGIAPADTAASSSLPGPRHRLLVALGADDQVDQEVAAGGVQVVGHALPVGHAGDRAGHGWRPPTARCPGRRPRPAW